MIDYKNGKVYKMVSPSGLTYIGSTTQSLAERKSHHKSVYVRKPHGNYNKVTSSALFADSLDGVVIVLLEEFPCDNKEQLFARERHYIESMECVNVHLPSGSTPKGKSETESQFNHRTRYKIKVTCDCGSEVSKTMLSRHRKTNIHKEWEKHQVE